MIRSRSILRNRACVLILVLLTTLAGACSSPQEASIDARAELLARPSSEQAVERYQQMQRRIQSEVEAVIGPRDWVVVGERVDDVCGFGRFGEQKDARSVSLPRSQFAGGITDTQWPRVSAGINSVLREYGFSSEGLVVLDRNGTREINAAEPATGATFTFGSKVNTLVRISTGCHLPQASKAGQ